VLPLRPGNWRTSELYLFGVDLYHHSYFWEAHEAWEQLWRLAERRSPVARLLRGLVQNAAAPEKAHAGNRRGAAKLSRSAAENLRAVASTGEFDEDGRFLGIRVGDLLADMERHYADLWAAPTEAASTGRGRPPRLNLA